MRNDPFGNPLHVRMYYKHGSYWYVYRNKWTAIGNDYATAMQNYAAAIAPSGGMVKLVADTFDWYERRVKSGDLKESSLRPYKSQRERIQGAFQEFAPSQVKTAHITSFLDFYFDQQPATANSALTVLRGIFDRGVRWGLCEYNPARSVQAMKVTARDRYLTDTEFLAIRGAAPPYLKLVMDMCYLTAQRIGDVLHIKQADISEDGVFFQQEKTKKRLLVESTPELEQLVKDARALNIVTGLYLFTKSASYPHCYATVRSHWVKACDMAGVNDARIHDIRAKAITDADAEGIDAQKLAGHATKAMTERYLRLMRTDRVQSPAKVRQLRG